MIRSKDKRYIKRILNVCENHNSKGRVNMGSLLVWNKRISVGPSKNDYIKSHPLNLISNRNFYKSGHAEMFVIAQALKARLPLNKATLYVAGYSKSFSTKSNLKSFNIPSSTKPCIYCQQLIKEFGIKRVVYINRKKDSFSIAEIIL